MLELIIKLTISPISILNAGLVLIFKGSKSDAPEVWQIGFQDYASPAITGIVELHNDIFFFLVIISLSVF